MSYGLLCKGEKGQSIIDSEHSVLHVMSSGIYAATVVGASGGVATVTYSNVIRSQVPPFIFVAPDGPASYGGLKHFGAPGEWVGFSISVIYEPMLMTGYSPSGKYCACSVSPPKTPGFGLQVFNEGCEIVFDSNHRIMNFVRGVQTWPFVDYMDLSLFQRAWMYALSWVGGPDDYFLLSGFSDTSINSMTTTVGFNNFERDKIFVCAVAWKTANSPRIDRPLLVARP